MVAVIAETAGPPANNLPPAQADRLWTAAKNFEAMTLGELLAPMFDTVDVADGLFGGGSAETMWRPMLVREIGKEMAARGGIGLAAPVFEALLRAQEGKQNDRSVAGSGGPPGSGAGRGKRGPGQT